MGIRLTTAIDTTKGSAANLYLHVTKFTRNKEGLSEFTVQYFKVKGGDIVIVDNTGLPSVFDFDISATIGTDSIEKAGYDAIGAALKEASLAPESDSSGAWVAY